MIKIACGDQKKAQPEKIFTLELREASPGLVTVRCVVNGNEGMRMSLVRFSEKAGKLCAEPVPCVNPPEHFLVDGDGYMMRGL